METQTKKLLKYLILPLILLAIAVFIAFMQSRPDFLLHLHFYDEGSVNVAVIRTFVGRTVVIDGGPTDGILKDIGRDLPFFDRMIDLIVLTKTDSKHIAGLVDVLKRYKVRMIILPSEPSNLSVYEELLSLIEKQGARKIYAQTGQRIWVDQATVFDITSSSGQLGMTLSFGKTHVLFPDDQHHNVELISDGVSLDKSP